MRHHHPPVRSVRSTASTSSGIVLLEALVALLIFAVGILGLIGLQAASIKQATAAEYRSVATLQANDLISRMWVADRTTSNLTAQFDSASDAAGYAKWKAEWLQALPGAATYPPTVTITSVAGGGTTPLSSSQVTVVVFWRAPSDTDTHNYSVVAQLK